MEHRYRCIARYPADMAPPMTVYIFRPDDASHPEFATSEFKLYHTEDGLYEVGVTYILAVSRERFLSSDAPE